MATPEFVHGEIGIITNISHNHVCWVRNDFCKRSVYGFRRLKHPIGKHVWIQWDDPSVSEVINPLTTVSTVAAFMNAAP
jgi:hypothetical protein